MKQVLDAQQYDELSEPAKQTWLAWVEARGILPAIVHPIHYLIRFIDEHMEGAWQIERNSEKDAWRIETVWFTDGQGEPELIDALWEVVKGLLEGEIPVKDGAFSR